MGLDANISLAVASLDLNLVQSIRSAMNTDAGRATPLGPAPNPPPGVGQGQDRYEPRRVFHPTPRYEPRRVLHPLPRVDTGPVLAPPSAIASGDLALPLEAQTSRITPSGIEPVWKTLPSVSCPDPTHDRPPVIRVVRPVPVISYKGTLLDFFV